LGHFCVNCGAALVTRVIEGREVEACPNDSFVLWHDPKVSTAVIVETDGGIVLGRRSIEPGYGLWCLPGGFVNDDEDPEAAAVRECFEEISAAVEVTGLIGVFHIAKTDAPSMLVIAYKGRLVDGAAPAAGAEMLEVAVFRPGSLRPMAPEGGRRIPQVPGAGGGSGTSARPRRGSACSAAITSASADATAAAAVNPAA